MTHDASGAIISNAVNAVQKAKALAETGIVFGLTLLLIALVSLSPIGKWERQTSNRPFVEYGVMILFPSLLLMAARRDMTAYGLALRNVAYHLDIAAAALVPVALASAVAAVVDYKDWRGSLVLTCAQVAALLATAWLLRSKPAADGQGDLPGAALLTVWLGLAAGVWLGECCIRFHLLHRLSWLR